MRNFKPGQKVVFKREPGTVGTSKFPNGKVLTIVGRHCGSPICMYWEVEEDKENAYHDYSLFPVENVGNFISATKEILIKFAPVEETSDAPIKEPELV